MYDGDVYNFNGTISGFIEGELQGNQIVGDFTNLNLQGFTGYVEASYSVDNTTNQPLIAGAGSTVNPNPVQAPVVVDDVDEDWDEDGDYEDDGDYGNYADYGGGYHRGVEFPLEFGDANTKFVIRAQYPSTDYIRNLADRVARSLTNAGVATLDTTYENDSHLENAKFSGADRAITHGDVPLSDERLRPALTTLIEGLRAPEVTVRSVEAFSAATGQPVDATAIRNLLV